MKENANFRIQALESALIELKLKSRKEIDQLSMTLEDIRSTAYNRAKPKTQSVELLKQFEKGMILNHMRDARSKLEEFAMALKAKTYELESAQETIETQNKLMDGWLTKLRDKDAYFREERKLRIFYQRMLMKFLRDVDAFHDDPVKQERFDILNEDETDMNYQRQVAYVLEMLEAPKKFIEIANRHHARIDNLKIAEEAAVEIGLMADDEEVTEEEEQDWVPPEKPVIKKKDSSVERSVSRSESQRSNSRKGSSRKIKRQGTKNSVKSPTKKESNTALNRMRGSSQDLKLYATMGDQSAVVQKDTIGGKLVDRV